MKSENQIKFCNKIKLLNFTTNSYFQNNQILFNELINIIFEASNVKSIRCKIRKNKQLNNWINDIVPALSNPFYDLSTKIYWIIFNITDFPVCDHEKCNNKILKNISLLDGYESASGMKYCSHKCSVSSAANKALHKKTCIEKYGVESYTQTNECKQKIIKTSIERYGTVNPGCSDKALAKIKNTNLERYGVVCSFQREDVKLKSKQTFVDHYGVDNNMKSKEGLKAYQNAMSAKYGEGIITNLQLEETKAKSKKTKLRKYGDENFRNPKKGKQTKFERYGNENYNNKVQFEQTMLSRYGVKYAQQCPQIRKKSGFRYSYNGIKFDSAPELAYYIWLTDNGIQFEYQPAIYISYQLNGKTHIYIPDFKLGETLVEIKGDQYVDKITGRWICPYDNSRNELYEAKHQCCLANNVQILYSADYRKYLDYIDQKYGKNYLKQFKNNFKKI